MIGSWRNVALTTHLDSICRWASSVWMRSYERDLSQMSHGVVCLNDGTRIIFDPNEQFLNSPWRQQRSQRDMASTEKKVNQYTSQCPKWARMKSWRSGTHENVLVFRILHSLFFKEIIEFNKYNRFWTLILFFFSFLKPCSLLPYYTYLTKQSKMQRRTGGYSRF